MSRDAIFALGFGGFGVYCAGAMFALRKLVGG
jgi:hypothetical protein